MRTEAYGQDIGQCSWTTAEELTSDIPRLNLSPSSRFLDLGCGPGGPLTFVARHVGCGADGVDRSPAAIASARARAASLGLAAVIRLGVADLNAPLPFPAGAFHAVLSVDVILHLEDRAAVFCEIARVLTPGGRFLFTDAGVVTGPATSDELQRRALHGVTQFVPPGFNEQVLERAGLRLLECEDRTGSALRIARGRLSARLARRTELDAADGAAISEDHLRYLETVIALSERGALARMMYLAESGSA